MSDTPKKPQALNITTLGQGTRATRINVQYGEGITGESVVIKRRVGDTEYLLVIDADEFDALVEGLKRLEITRGNWCKSTELEDLQF